MKEALLYHAGIGFVDGVGKRNSAIAGRRTAVLLIALIDHDDFAEFPVAWGLGLCPKGCNHFREEASLDWTWEES